MPDPVAVRVRDCACPHTPHADEGDIIYLAPTLGIDGGYEAERDLIEAQGNERVLTRRWLNTFIRYGAVAWNLQDEDGDDVPFDVEAILSNWALARPLAVSAEALYTESITAPFVTKQQVRSPTGRTAATTSRSRRPTASSPASP